MILLRSLLLLSILSASVYGTKPHIVHLTPPAINSSFIAIAAACDRPRRTGGMNISIEPMYNKLIVHCYGHGGYGYTTLFGSIQEAISLLMHEKPDLKKPIRIIGSGCMGLTMAIELYRMGFTNITISTEEKYNIPSWRAGGFFDPGVGNESTEIDRHRVALGLATYVVLHEIEHGMHPYLTKDVVRRLPIYCSADIECEVEILEKLKFMPPSELVTIDFGNGIIHENYKKQFTYFINITELMNQLWENIERLHIPVIIERVNKFSDCSESIICNCSGLGSQLLNNDDALVPTRGHFFMLKDQLNNESLDYMLFTKVIQNGQKEMIYFFPKSAFKTGTDDMMNCAGMLGGTFIPYLHSDISSRNKLDECELEKLAERTQSFFYGT